MESKLILIVEDDADQREGLYELLADAGHKVAMAATGGQALELIVSDCPVLVLADVSLPDMDGRELLRRIRLICPDPPSVVFITGLHPSKTQDISAEVLQKPFSIEKLMNIVNHRIGGPTSTFFATGY